MASTTAQKRASQKWQKNNYKRIPLDVRPEMAEAIKTHATGRGETVGGFIKRAINETIENDLKQEGQI